MKKKILAVVAALAIMTVGTTAFASESPTAGSTELVAADETQEAEVGDVEKPADSVEKMAEDTRAGAEGLDIASNAVSDTTVSETVTAATNAISNLAELAVVLGDEDLAETAKDSTKKVSAAITAVVNLEVTDGEIDPVKGTKITIMNENIKAGKTYAILHYVGGKWVTIKPEDVKAGSLAITVTSLSPVAIVEIVVDDAAADLTTDTKAPAANTAVTTVASTTAASSSDGTSPKTGETTPVALFALLACVAGAFACSKKSEKN